MGQFNSACSLGCAVRREAFLREVSYFDEWDASCIQEFAPNPVAELFFDGDFSDYDFCDVPVDNEVHKIIIAKPFPGSHPVAMVIHSKWVSCVKNVVFHARNLRVDLQLWNRGKLCTLCLISSHLAHGVKLKDSWMSQQAILKTFHH